MLQDHLQEVLERWKTVFTEYSALKFQAEQAVVRWEWATGERYNLRPFYFNRFPGRGRSIKEPAASLIKYFTYGFDELNRVRVHRYFFSHGGKSNQHLYDFLTRSNSRDVLFSESFYNYDSDKVEIIEFSAVTHIPLQVQQLFFTNDRLNLYVSFKLNGYTPLFAEKGKNPDELYDWLGYNGRFNTVEQYTYAENRLKTISSYREVPGIDPYSDREEFLYDESGKLQRIERINESSLKQVVYQKRQKSQTFHSLRQAAIQKMVEAIIDRLQSAKIKEQIYSIELFYQSALHHFPPALVVFPEGYRQKIIQSKTRDFLYQVFLPANPATQWFLEITNPETLEICGILEWEIQASGKWQTATLILREVAAYLTKYDWSNILSVTPDFVVFAIDPEMEGHDLISILSSSVSMGQIQEWKEKGWLG
jgi:hypothetical protein